MKRAVSPALTLLADLRAALLVAVVATVLVATPRDAAASFAYDPRLEWSTLETPHFSIHFHDGLEGPANRLAPMSERVLAELEHSLGWSVSSKIDVVLADHLDLTNGSARPVPWNRIEIYVARPEPDSVLNAFDDDLVAIFRHELAHILSISQRRGLTGWLSGIFGRHLLLFPGIFLPPLLTEGLAVAVESADGHSGRNHSTYADTVLRMEVANGLRPLERAITHSRTWPNGNVPYLYGGRFSQYLVDRFGERALHDYWEENADNLVPWSDALYPIPGLYNKDARDVFGETFATLWPDFLAELERAYQPQVDALRSAGLTRYETLTPSKAIASLPRFSPDGRTLYWVEKSLRGPTRLVRHDLATGRRDELDELRTPLDLTITRQGCVLVADLERRATYTLWSAVFERCPDDASLERTPMAWRARALDALPDGEHVLLVQNDAGRTRLVIARRDGATEPEVVFLPADVLLTQARVDATGTRVALVVREIGGRYRLAVLDLPTRTLTYLTDGSFTVSAPTWTSDGERVVFSADPSGVFDLYAVNLEDGARQRLTRVLGGAFAPTVSPDGTTLVFASYEADGMGIARMPWPAEPLEVSPTLLEPRALDAIAAEHPTAAHLDVVPERHPYSPWASLAPSAWALTSASYEPYPGATSWGVGAAISGSDTLFRYGYDLATTVYAGERRASVSALVQAGLSWPNVALRYRDNGLFLGDDPFPFATDSVPFHEESFARVLTRSVEGMIELPWATYFTSQRLTLALDFSRDTTFVYRPLVLGAGTTPAFVNVVQRYDDTMTWVRASYRLDTTRRYEWSVSPERGRELALRYARAEPALASDYEVNRATFDYAEYVPGLGPNHVFVVGARGGLSRGGPDHLAPFSLGRYPSLLGDHEASAPAQDAFGLRGFASGTHFGNAAAVGSLEYRAPLFQTERGFAWMPTFPASFRDLSLTAFVDAGNVTMVEDELFARDELKVGVGGELGLDFLLGYGAVLGMRFGYARGFGDLGQDTFYVTVAAGLPTAVVGHEARVPPTAR